MKSKITLFFITLFTLFLLPSISSIEALVTIRNNAYFRLLVSIYYKEQPRNPLKEILKPGETRTFDNKNTLIQIIGEALRDEFGDAFVQWRNYYYILYRRGNRDTPKGINIDCTFFMRLGRLQGTYEVK